ncbi:MAG TPA: BREX-1 system adenine-specific DNA-methyltransferase PglX [Bacilli bacterium]|nr:BREX-1 system adenine-specific DNA-methyltransferase PglX [Bacilli bacterium]
MANPKALWKKFALLARHDILQRVAARDPHSPQELETAAYTWFQRLLVLLCLQARGLCGEEQGQLRHRDLPHLLPTLFAPLDESIDRLLPDDLLPPDSELVAALAKFDLAEFRHVERIGWLHQDYMSVQKDAIFAEKKRNIKIGKADIPAATQLFTPAWIVQFLVQNSLGRYWVERRPESERRLTANWRYYLSPAEAMEKATNATEGTEAAQKNAPRNLLPEKRVCPEALTLLDPACGAGHILIYAFELLVDIYKDRGYAPHDIPRLILRHNLYGFDIDERAATLASFALLMKAQELDPDILQDPPKLNIVAFQEPEEKRFKEGTRARLQEDELLRRSFTQFAEAKQFGSLLRPTRELLPNHEALCADDPLVADLLRQADLLTRRYDIVITNPPYMGAKGMNPELHKFIKQHYPRTRKDLFAAFLERMESFCRPGGLLAAVTMQSWMFLSSFAAYRERLLQEHSIEHLVHLGHNVMGISFGTAAAVLRCGVTGRKGTYQFIQQSDLQDGEPIRFPLHNARSAVASSEQFRDLPGSLIAYWTSPAMRRLFREQPSLGETAEPRQGLATGDNERYVRYWWEVEKGDIGFGCGSIEEAHARGVTWFPYNKGGAFRKWYGNNEYVLAFDERHYRELLVRGNRLPSRAYYFREGITWSFVNASKFGVRYSPPGFLFDVGGSSLFPAKEWIPYLTAFLCSKVAYEFLQVVNPTLNFQVGNIRSLPFLLDGKTKGRITELAEENIALAKEDWDSGETSWEFAGHPLLQKMGGIKMLEEAYQRYEREAASRFRRVQANEERLNELFLQIYGLVGELTPEVLPQEITMQRPTREEAAKSLLSYVAGWRLGRFRTGDGAGERFPGVSMAMPEADALHLSNEANASELVLALSYFLTCMFGTDSLQTNLDWLAASLSGKAQLSTAKRLHAYFATEFYDDHLKRYRQRPIYQRIEGNDPHKLPKLVYTKQHLLVER